MTDPVSVNVQFNTSDGQITFNPSGEIQFTAKTGKTRQVNYILSQDAGATFAPSPIQFVNKMGEKRNPPQGTTVDRLSDCRTQVGITAPAAGEMKVRFKVVLKDASGTVFLSSDPTIIIMRPDGG